MEKYSLLFLLIAMIAIWWWTWAPWQKKTRRDAPPQDDADREERPRR